MQCIRYPYRFVFYCLFVSPYISCCWTFIGLYRGIPTCRVFISHYETIDKSVDFCLALSFYMEGTVKIIWMLPKCRPGAIWRRKHWNFFCAACNWRGKLYQNKSWYQETYLCLSDCQEIAFSLSLTPCLYKRKPEKRLILDKLSMISHILSAYCCWFMSLWMCEVGRNGDTRRNK